MRVLNPGLCVAVLCTLASPAGGSAAEVRITEVTPRLVSTEGGTQVTFVGSGFTATMTARIGTQPLGSQEFVDAQHIRGVSPALAQAEHDATVSTAAGGIVARLPDGVEAAPPPRLRSVEPTQVLSDGSTEVTIAGAYFRPETVFTIGRNEIQNPTVTSGTAVGRAPALGPLDLPGPRDVIAEDSRGRAVLRDAVTYVDAPQLIRIEPKYLATRGGTEIRVVGKGLTKDLLLHFDGGKGTIPLEVPTTLEGPTLLRGVAPAHARGKMDAVLKRSPAALEVDRLRGAVEYVAPWAPGPQEVEGTLVDGAAELHWVNPIGYSAIEVYRDGVHVATLPGDAMSYVETEASTREKGEYTVVGKLSDGLSAAAVAHVAAWKCDPPADHGIADCGDKDFPIYGEHPAYGEGGSGAAQYQNSGAYHATYIDAATHETLLQARVSPFRRGPNELVTGFTILDTATKLRIMVHGAKTMNGPDLSLRVLIQSVTSGVDRVQELVVPDILLGTEKDWMDFTYNTERPDPDDPARVDPPLPPADYKVTLYAVGGGVPDTFYEISSDASPDQNLVPGVGCPPYPLVHVWDTTGRNSNPEILEIHQYGESQAGYFPPTDPSGNYINPVLATLEADTFDPDGDPVVSYKWTLKDGNSAYSEILSVKQTAANTTLINFPDYGYYYMDLEVKDHRCGKATKTCIVKVYPPPPCFNTGDARLTYPFPKPNRVYYVPNLPGGMDWFSGTVPATFRAFVVDPGFCQGADAQTQWVQFGIFPPTDLAGSGSPLTLTNGQQAVVDACIPEPDGCVQAAQANDNSGGRFWEAVFPNMNLLPHIRYPNGEDVKTYRLMGRGSTNAVNDKPNAASEWRPWSPIQVLNASKLAIAKSEDINICPKPRYLDEPANYTTGSREYATGKYIFTSDSAPPGGGGHEFDDTDPVDIDVGELPPQANGVGSITQKGTLIMDQGVWSMPSYKGGSDVTALNGNVAGTRELLSGGGGAGDGAGASYGFDPETLSFDYCMRQTLFEESFDTILFESVLYCCFIGPIPASVSVSVSLGLSILIDTQISAHLSALDPENPFIAHFWLLPQVDISLAASISADVLFGIISIEAGFDFIATFFMPFHLGMDKSGIIGPEFGLRISMTLSLWLRLCAFWGMLCIPDLEFNILDDVTLMETGNPDAAPSGCPGGAGGGLPEVREILDDAAQGRGAGLPPIPMENPDYQISIASSPSGNVQILAGAFFGYGHIATMVRVIGKEWMFPARLVLPDQDLDSEYGGQSCDPKVVFLDEGNVVLAWTQNMSNLDPGLEGLDAERKASRVLSNSEIVYIFGEVEYDVVEGAGSVFWHSPVRLTNDSAAAGGPLGDGKVKLARAAGSEIAAWATWVRFETPDLLHPETGEVQMRETSIYAQKIRPDGPVGQRVLISQEPGTEKYIDIEPAIATSPDNSVTYVVWVNDPLHDDLVTSNRGRALLYSKFQGGAWSAPAHVLDADSEAAIPGILSPSFALLKNGTHGMLAFTALPANAPESDSGIQNTRIVYTAKLLDGVWEQPVLVFKECFRPLHGHLPQVETPDPFQENPFKPDFTIVMQEVGAYGTREGAGNVVALTYDGMSWSQPINLTPDDRVHQRVASAFTAQGEVVVVHQSPAVASARLRALGVGRGAGALFDDLMTQAVPAVADPAISYCRISDAFAGPGAKIKATIGVANRGLSHTPITGAMSSLDVTAVHVLPDGTRKEVWRSRCPILKAGEETMFSFDLTVPRTPVKISFEVDPVGGELNPDDNVRVRSLGAQSPETPTASFLQSAAGGEAVLLRWKNVGLYDSILFYRDGKLVTELPGTATSHVDRGAGLLHQPGLLARHEYALRGARGQSRSIPATCVFIKPPPEARFKRGDTNGDGTLNITDGVYVLNFLFLGGDAPPCKKAADTDDSGGLNITDGVYVLNFLFLGGERPPAPYPFCGLDPTADSLDCRVPPSCRP